MGTYKETQGGPDVHVNETACLARAVDVWHYCGSHANEEVDAIYGLSGNACFIGYGYLLPIDLPAWLFHTHIRSIPRIPSNSVIYACRFIA